MSQSDAGVSRACQHAQTVESCCTGINQGYYLDVATTCKPNVLRAVHGVSQMPQKPWTQNTGQPAAALQAINSLMESCFGARLSGLVLYWEL